MNENMTIVTKELGESIHHTLIASNFPIKQWNEWKKQCKEQFNDIYWHKIWTDHLKAKMYEEQNK